MTCGYLFDHSGLFTMSFSWCLLDWVLFVRIERSTMQFITVRLNVPKISIIVTSLEVFPERTYMIIINTRRLLLHVF